MALFGRQVDAVAREFAWTRTVEMERAQWVARKSDWGPAMQSSDVRNVEKHRGQRWVSVPGPMVPGAPGPDGTPGPAQPTMSQELQSYTYYTYEALEWRTGRHVTAAGSDQSRVEWPDYALGHDERVLRRTESYAVTFTRVADPSRHATAKDYQATLDEAQWRSLVPGQACRLTLGILGGVRKVSA